MKTKGIPSLLMGEGEGEQDGFWSPLTFILSRRGERRVIEDILRYFLSKAL